MPSLNLTTQLYVDGAWTTYPSYQQDGWSVLVGQDDESGLPRPSKITFALANHDLSMDPTNASSPLYGKIGRNTRARMLMDGLTLSQAEASSWQPADTSEHQVSPPRGRAWVDVTAEGLLRRLSRWDEPLASPMRRQIGSYEGLSGYWPLEDPSGAANLAQEVPGAAPGKFSGSVTLAGDDGPGGSGECVTIGAGGLIRGVFQAGSGSGWQVCWAAKLGAAPTSATFHPIMSWTDTLSRVWRWTVNNSQFGLSVVDSEGATLVDVAASYGTIDVDQWIRYRVKVTVSGSTTTYEPAWYVQDGSIITGYGGTFTASTTGQPRGWSAVANDWTEDAAYAHMFATSSTSLDLTGTSDAVKSFNGYLGERAGWRFHRLMSEQGLQPYAGGDYDQTMPMGRQKPGRMTDLIAECAVTDAAIVFDEPLGIGLTFRPRVALYNRDPGLSLSKSQLSAPLRKVIDDVGVVNAVTVRNADGTEAVAQLSSGALSVQPPPDGVGVYRGTVDVNVADSGVALADRVQWELSKGTLERPRYPRLTLDLGANPSLRDDVTAMRPGDWIEVADLEPDPVYLRMMGAERAGNAVDDVVTFACLPADLYQVAVIDDPETLIGSSSTTLSADVDSAATGLSFSTDNPVEVWSSATPYDVVISGERITVNAMGAATGSGPYVQAATVTRSVNGVTKSLPAGAPIHIAGVRRLGL